MSRIKSKDTQIEGKLRKYLWHNGIRSYRIKNNTFGKPDFIFKKHKIAVFIDGCFWHKCPEHYVEPKSNESFWLPKIDKNVQRDEKVNKKLKDEGWKVIRFWEHEINNNLEYCAKKLITILNIE